MSQKFCSVYLCMHFQPLRRLLSDEKQHNFNTNLFMLCCCKTSLLINLRACWKLRSTSLVAFCFDVQGLASLKVLSLCRKARLEYWAEQSSKHIPFNLCTSIYTWHTILTRCVMSRRRNDVRTRRDIHFGFDSMRLETFRQQDGTSEPKMQCEVLENCEVLCMIFNYR